jgi:hypothetical protein
LNPPANPPPFQGNYMAFTNNISEHHLIQETLLMMITDLREE